MRSGPRWRAAPSPAHPEGASCTSLSRRKQQSLEAEEAKRRLKEQSIFVSYFPGLLCLARNVSMVGVFCPLRAWVGHPYHESVGSSTCLVGSWCLCEKQTKKQTTATTTAKHFFSMLFSKLEKKIHPDSDPP